MQFIPLNFYSKQDYENISKLEITNNFKFFMVRSKVILDKEEYQQKYSSQKHRFIAKYNDFTKINYKIDAVNNNIELNFNNNKINLLYSDLY